MHAQGGMRDLLQDALDELVSSRTSSARQGEALNTLEKLLARVCVHSVKEAPWELRTFNELQDAFECNVSSRLLSWISTKTSFLEHHTSKGSFDYHKDNEISTLIAQLIQGLSILQGVMLIHVSTKTYLSRRYPLEVLLDLLLMSRHFVLSASASSFDNSAASPMSSPTSEPSPIKRQTGSSTSAPLTSAALDTLLCMLVDSSPALRVFEELHGVQAVVKLLKRSGTPREVRMKCLEFLYFYLMDETTASASLSMESPRAQSPIPTAPSTPTRLHAHHRSTTSMSSSSSHSHSSSFGSISSTTSVTTTSSGFSGFSASTNSDTSAVHSLAPPAHIHAPRPRSLLMLRKDVDYVPQSPNPKKAGISRLGMGIRSQALPRISGKSLSRMREEVFSSETESEDFSLPAREANVRTPVPISKIRGMSSSQNDIPDTPMPTAGTPIGRHRRAQSCADVEQTRPIVFKTESGRESAWKGGRSHGVRTMEEKKEILGGMLGNVDALVEGVRKAGVWGLG